MLFNFAGAALDTTALSNAIEYLQPFFKFLIFLDGGVIRVVPTEKGPGRDEMTVVLQGVASHATVARAGLRLFSLLLEVGHGAGHFGDHHFNCRWVECVRLISL